MTQQPEQFESNYPIHPLAKLFPLLEGVFFRDLVEDIREHGLREPIALVEGKILDGRNRLRACHAAQIPLRFRTVDTKDPLSYVTSANLHRRHLDTTQRAMIAAQIVQMRLGKARGAKGAVIAEVSEALKIAPGTTECGLRVKKEGASAVKKAVADGALTVSAAAELIASCDKREQTRLLKEHQATGESLVDLRIRARGTPPAKRSKKEENPVYQVCLDGPGRIGELEMERIEGWIKRFEGYVALLHKIAEHISNPEPGITIMQAINPSKLKEMMRGL